MVDGATMNGVAAPSDVAARLGGWGDNGNVPEFVLEPEDGATWSSGIRRLEVVSVAEVGGARETRLIGFSPDSSSSTPTRAVWTGSPLAGGVRYQFRLRLLGRGGEPLRDRVAAVYGRSRLGAGELEFVLESESEWGESVGGRRRAALRLESAGGGELPLEIHRLRALHVAASGACPAPPSEDNLMNNGNLVDAQHLVSPSDAHYLIGRYGVALPEGSSYCFHIVGYNSADEAVTTVLSTSAPVTVPRSLFDNFAVAFREWSDGGASLRLTRVDASENAAPWPSSASRALIETRRLASSAATCDASAVGTLVDTRSLRLGAEDDVRTARHDGRFFADGETYCLQARLGGVESRAGVRALSETEATAITVRSIRAEGTNPNSRGLPRDIEVSPTSASGDWLSSARSVRVTLAEGASGIAPQTFSEVTFTGSSTESVRVPGRMRLLPEGRRYRFRVDVLDDEGLAVMRGDDIVVNAPAAPIPPTVATLSAGDAMTPTTLFSREEDISGLGLDRNAYAMGLRFMQAVEGGGPYLCGGRTDRTDIRTVGCFYVNTLGIETFRVHGTATPTSEQISAALSAYAAQGMRMIDSSDDLLCRRVDGALPDGLAATRYSGCRIEGTVASDAAVGDYDATFEFCARRDLAGDTCEYGSPRIRRSVRVVIE